MERSWQQQQQHTRNPDGSPATTRLTLTPAGWQLLKTWEGCRLSAYPDPASGGDPWTIGYGHTGPEVSPGLTISQAQADGWLEADVAKAAAAVNRLLAPVALSPTQRDALVSFCFNVGAAALESSTLRRRLLAGLGRSAMAQRYGIADLAEARDYLADPLLRQRLMAVIDVIDDQLSRPGQNLEHLMGSGLDAAKTVSSLTLFEAAGLDSAGALLDQIGWRCERTLEQLR